MTAATAARGATSACSFKPAAASAISSFGSISGELLHIVYHCCHTAHVMLTFSGWRTIRLDVPATRGMYTTDFPKPGNENMASRGFGWSDVSMLVCHPHPCSAPVSQHSTCRDSASPWPRCSFGVLTRGKHVLELLRLELLAPERHPLSRRALRAAGDASLCWRERRGAGWRA